MFLYAGVLYSALAAILATIKMSNPKFLSGLTPLYYTAKLLTASLFCLEMRGKVLQVRGWADIHAI